MIALDIKKMSTREKLKVMEELWDALSHEEKEIESAEWHKEILDERSEKIENGDAEFISVEELKASVRK